MGSDEAPELPELPPGAGLGAPPVKVVLAVEAIREGRDLSSSVQLLWEHLYGEALPMERPFDEVVTELSLALSARYGDAAPEPLPRRRAPSGPPGGADRADGFLVEPPPSPPGLRGRIGAADAWARRDISIPRGLLVAVWLLVVDDLVIDLAGYWAGGAVTVAGMVLLVLYGLGAPRRRR